MSATTIKTIYDKSFLKNTLYLLEAEVKDLGHWNVYNDDVINVEMELLRSIIEEIKERTKQNEV